ncbi:MBL fold metallo-hydrolase [uncultured Hyphomonas sp.]|uniref:MBL fold metallo-hydrolase n=1 Tax=uncultured Hyphomonas sp. TaxID=225298 RepID=UPI002AAB2713|nr:MBL fold metallo-hydrolase [uncultured Hyphomonas sp.]
METKKDKGDPAHTSLSLNQVALGDFRITALSDGQFDIPAPFLVLGKVPLAASPDPLPLDINAFLVEGRGRKVLVDTGCGSKLGPTVNRTVSHLRAVGVDSSEVDTVLCTHIHPDHTNGLVDAAGGAVFPNAEIHVNRRELDYWLNESQMSRAPDPLKIQFAWAMQAFLPYRNQLQPFDDGHLAVGIEAVPLIGHTPGHTGFLIDGGGNQQLLIWGDTVHAIDQQAANPDISVIADVDQELARTTRRSLFDRVAVDKIRVAGMHLPFPGFGQLRQCGDGFAYDVNGG